MDFDPRDYDDSRDRRDDDERDPDHDDGLTLGRGPGSHKLDDHHDDPRERDDDWREARDRDGQDRDVGDRDGFDPRDVFVRDLDLPRGHDRERVLDRDRTYELNGDDSRTLATVGAFRVVSERDLRESRDATPDGRDTDLRHLRDEGLVRSVPLNERDRAVVLTDRGRSVLEGHRRDRDPDHRQAFYARADKPRERTHDAQIYRAYLRAAERLRDRDARVLRVQLDRELKREYQRFLQERNRDRSDSDGRPVRDVGEIEEWAKDHDLPYFDEQVHFPDLRIEYEDIDGNVRCEGIEVVTEHYRGGHSSAVTRSGFTVYRSGGGGGSRGAPSIPTLLRSLYDPAASA